MATTQVLTPEIEAKLKLYENLTRETKKYFLYVKPLKRAYNGKRLRFFTNDKRLREINEEIKKAKDNKDYKTFFELLDRKQEILNEIKSSEEYIRLSQKFKKVSEIEKNTEKAIVGTLKSLGYSQPPIDKIERELRI